MARTKTKALPAAGSGDGAARKRLMSRAVMNPVTAHAALTQTFLGPISGGDLDQGAIMEALGDDVLAIKGGDLGSVERMLYAQATTLNGAFIDLAHRSCLNMRDYLPAAETFMRLALKAQSQCRATLETLATIKNPPVVYARQANFAAGPQQVNNGVAARTGESDPAPN